MSRFQRWNTRLINFYFFFYFLEFWWAEKSTCYRCYYEWENPFVTCFWGQIKVNPGKRTNRKLVVINLFSLYNAEAPVCPHTQFLLADQIVLETDFIWCEAWKSMTFHIKNKSIEVKRNRHCSIMMNWNEKSNIADGVWIETSIGSVKK